MNKVVIKISLIILLGFILVKCTDDYDDNPQRGSVNDFVWKGLNQFYFWLEDSPDLVDGRFSSNNQYTDFLNSFTSPESLFEHLLIDRSIDRFSVIFSDYNVLEQTLTGSTASNGVDYELRYVEGSSTELFGWVRYVMPNSDASSKNIQRGDIFYAVDGLPLTINNYKSLLDQNSYTLSIATLNNGVLTPTGENINLNKFPYSENPVLIRNVHVIGSKRIGYLMYNGFYSNYETELNQAFAYFQSENITHLILDLRYNSGGSVNTATRLASMITGQFQGQVFARQQWNYKIENYYSNNQEALINRFTSTLANGSAINSLQLNKLFVLTSKRTASASELVINGLKPYIDVVQIGDVTVGKNVGSITLYDSPTFRKENVNPAHRYAMQPIVLKIANANGFSDYVNGISPDVLQIEDLENLGVLGDDSDPLLNAALNYVDLNGRFVPSLPIIEYRAVEDNSLLRNLEEAMYLE